MVSAIVASTSGANSNASSESSRPTLLALPHPEDEHPDHCSTHIFVREAMATVPPNIERGVHVVHYLIHYGQWPLNAEGGPGRTLEPR